MTLDILICLLVRPCSRRRGPALALTTIYGWLTWRDKSDSHY